MSIMSKSIQIRGVPNAVHRKLKARATKAGQSLSEYLLREFQKIAERPTLAEMMARLAKHKPIELEESSAAIIREHRGPLGS